jgi:hypothetical protein
MSPGISNIGRGGVMLLQMAHLIQSIRFGDKNFALLNYMAQINLPSIADALCCALT